MKLTKTKLKQIIKEEISRTLKVKNENMSDSSTEKKPSSLSDLEPLRKFLETGRIDNHREYAALLTLVLKYNSPTVNKALGIKTALDNDFSLTRKLLELFPAGGPWEEDPDWRLEIPRETDFPHGPTGLEDNR